MACIVANLGPGLDYNEQTRQIEVRISTDAGNAARFGSDGDLYAPVATAPGPIQWPVTVATLPAQAIAATGGSNTVLPSTSPQAIEYAAANRIDIYATSVCAMDDGVALEVIANRDSNSSTYLDNPSVVAWHQVGSVAVPSMVYDAGTRVSPTARNAPSDFTDPDGGWAGFYSHPYAVRTVAELLRIVRGRMVVAMFVRLEGLTDDAQAVAAVESVVNAVVAAGAQDWVIIMPQDVLDDGTRVPLDAMMAVITGAGITGGVNVFVENGDVFEPAEIVASGATWVDIASPSRPDGASGARIGEFVSAGLEVMVFTDARHYWTDWAFGLGARAVRSGDGVYARGGRGQPGDLDYRQTLIPGLATRGATVGAISPRTATYSTVYEQGFARQDETGRWFPERYGWVDGAPPIPNSQLLGTICPIPNTTDYRIRLRVWRPERESSVTTAAFAGIGFALLDDRDIANFVPNQLGYAARLHPPSSTAGWEHMSLVRYDGSGANTTLAESNDPPGWAYEEWTELSVTVQGSTITFTATASTGTATISANDATYRGSYASYIWYETSQRPILHAYDNPVNLVTYEALS